MPLVLTTDTNPGNAQWLPGGTDPTLAPFSFYQPGTVVSPTKPVGAASPIGDPAVVVPALVVPPTGLVWWYVADFTGVFTNSAVAPAQGIVQLFIDGVLAAAEVTAIVSTSAGTGIPTSLPILYGAALPFAVPHTFEMYWTHTGGGTTNGVGTFRSLRVTASLKRI